MSWLHPTLLLLVLPAAGVVWWTGRNSLHPMGPERRRALLAVRSALAALALLALAGPAWKRAATERAVILVMDHSHSQGEAGMKTASEEARREVDELLGKIPVM